MTTQVTLLTSHDTFTRLHEITDTKKASLKVGRDELLHLLIDHSVMYKALHNSSQFVVTEPTKRERPRAIR